MFRFPLLFGTIVLFSVLRCNNANNMMDTTSKGVHDFSLDLLQHISVDPQNSNKNFMISPYSVWSLLVLLYDGSSGETYNQLRQTLRISVDDQTLSGFLKAKNQFLNTKSSGVDIGSLQAIYTDIKYPIMRSYWTAIQNYNVKPVEVNFNDLSTGSRINQDISRSTRGLIKNSVQQRDLLNARMFLLSSLYFKGQWTIPFNKEITRDYPFHNENDEVIAQVPMMAQEGNFAAVPQAKGLGAHVIQMTYGSLEWISMIVIVPEQKVTLNAVINNLKTVGLHSILKQLADYKTHSPDASINVIMPKFETSTDLSLKEVLTQMGIRDLFDEKTANLDRMAKGLFASLCKHSSKITVDEEGTTAAAVTVAELSSRFAPATLRVNKPFLYLIVEKESGLLLFAGQVRNPKAA